MMRPPPALLIALIANQVDAGYIARYACCFALLRFRLRFCPPLGLQHLFKVLQRIFDHVCPAMSSRVFDKLFDEIALPIIPRLNMLGHPDQAFQTGGVGHALQDDLVDGDRH